MLLLVIARLSNFAKETKDCSLKLYLVYFVEKKKSNSSGDSSEREISEKDHPYRDDRDQELKISEKDHPHRGNSDQEMEILKKDHPYREDNHQQKDADKSTPRTIEANSANHELKQIKQALSDTRESQLKCFEEQQKRFEDLQQQLKAAMDDQTAQQQELMKQYEELKKSRYQVDGLTRDKREAEENEKEKKKKHSSDSSASDSDSQSSSDSSAGSAKKSFQHLSANQDNVPSNLQFHVTTGGKEACLWTKGSHGLLICK